MKRTRAIGMIIATLALIVAISVAYAQDGLSAPSVTFRVDGTSVTLSWNTIEGAASYHVWEWETSTGWVRLDDGSHSGTTFTRSGLESGKAYYYSVAAVNASGEIGTYSEYTQAVTVEGGEEEPTPTTVASATPTPTPTPTPETPTLDITIAPENRCADYDASDYSYPQSLEADIVDGMGGRIYGPYTGTYFDSTDETDIEHIVARSEAHDSGMCAASDEKKREFARDLANLTLASPSVNRHQKSAKDLAEWMPTLNQCWYANQVVLVKRKYNLTMDQAEADKAQEVLGGCTSTDMIFTEEAGVTATPTPTPTETATPTLTPTATETPAPAQDEEWCRIAQEHTIQGETLTKYRTLFPNERAPGYPDIIELWTNGNEIAVVYELDGFHTHSDGRSGEIWGVEYYSTCSYLLSRIWFVPFSWEDGDIIILMRQGVSK